MISWWWVRHGPTHRKDMIGWTDVPADLTNTHHVTALQNSLPNAPVVSSDLIRAVQTADAVRAERPRLPHSNALREINFGQWEARHFDDLDLSHGAHLRQFWEQPGDIRAPDGESWIDLSTRVNEYVDTFTGHRHVIAVAHMGPILTQVQRALGLTPYQALGHKIDNLSITRLDWDGTRWQAAFINHRPDAT